MQSSSDVSDANSKSYHTFLSREERGTQPNVLERDGYGKKGRVNIGGKRKTLENLGLFKEKNVKDTGPRESFVKPFFFQAQTDKSKTGLVCKPKPEGQRGGGKRGKRDKLSPRGDQSPRAQSRCPIKNRSPVLEEPGSEGKFNSPRNESGHATETTPMDHNRKFLYASRSGGKTKAWKRLARGGGFGSGERKCFIFSSTQTCPCGSG